MVSSEIRKAKLRTIFQRSSAADRLSAIVVAIALIAGIGLRVARLGSVPAGFGQDEACDGYDAYSILKTGRDHHGNLLPLKIQGFNDYRMPLFQYTLVPLVGTLGLSPAVVRLGAALWGIADLVAITILGGLTLGLPGAAASALLGALSPWHLTMSRYGIEATAASGTITLAVLCFYLWLNRRDDRWLLVCAVFLGLSLYAYSITKAVVPIMVVLLTLLYRSELRQSASKALIALGAVILLAVPQFVPMLHHLAETQAAFNRLSLFHYLSTCPGCEPAQARMISYSIPERLACFGANWISYFTPSFLFVTGDRGDHWTLLHPPGFGQLLPEQALLIALAPIAMFKAPYRKFAILLIAWLILASFPAALTVPLGAWMPEPRDLPTPWLLSDHTAYNVPLTPRLLLSHPDSRHGALAMAPWALLSALGFAVLLDLTGKITLAKMAAPGLLLAGVMFHGARFVRAYFIDYPVLAAPYFQYGMEQVVEEIKRLDGPGLPVVITNRVNQPYIYVLFFEPYAPAQFQGEQVLYGKGVTPPPSNLFAPVLTFDRYIFSNTGKAFAALEHGIFVFNGNEVSPAPPSWSVRYPDGSVAYNVVVK